MHLLSRLSEQYCSECKAQKHGLPLSVPPDCKGAWPPELPQGAISLGAPRRCTIWHPLSFMVLEEMLTSAVTSERAWHD